MLIDKLKACWVILMGQGVFFNMRIWREGEEICMSSKNRRGGGMVCRSVFHAGEDFRMKPGPVLRFPLVDRLAAEAATKKEPAP